MLRAQARFYAQQAAIGLQAVDCAKGCEHLAKLKGDEAVRCRADALVGAQNVLVRLPGQAERLEDDGSAAVTLDAVDLLQVGVGVKERAGLVADECAGHESAAIQRALRRPQHFLPLRLADEVGEAGVHIYRWRQARCRCAPHMIGQAGIINFAVGAEGQQNRRYTFNAPLRADKPLRLEVLCHSPILCISSILVNAVKSLECQHTLSQESRRGEPKCRPCDFLGVLVSLVFLGGKVFALLTFGHSLSRDIAATGRTSKRGFSFSKPRSMPSLLARTSSRKYCTA